VQDHESLLSFGQHKIKNVTREQNLSPRGDAEEAAANLFSMIRILDQSSNHIAEMPIPDTGLGRAINDRLRRAATPDTAS
jgi:L-threonylcarbamoyladenylate synthase